jgi:tetratricopeptide (TPR) repeat protein
MKKIGFGILFCACLSLGTAAADDLQISYSLEYYGKYADACTLGEKLTAENPKEYFFALRAGWLAYLAGKYSRSLDLYQNALLLKSDSLEPRLGQLLPLLALGKYKQVEMTALAILRSDPKNYTARIKLAYALYLAGEFSRSEKQYAELEADFPSDATVLMGLGWAQLKQGKKSPAQQQFNRVKTMFPENKYADEGLKWAK